MAYPGSFDHQSNVNPTQLTRPGSKNGGADSRELYLKLFSGEMFKGFQRNTIARDLVQKRTLTSGKSMQFIYTGRTTAEYHVPGQSILGNDQKKIGYALAEKYDRLIFRAIAKGARQKSPVGFSDTSFKEPGGTQVRVGSATGATAFSEAYDAGDLITAFYDAAAAMDEKGVSSEGRVAVLNPRQYYALIQNAGNSGAGLINRDAEGTALQSGQGIIEIAGIKIYKSMNIPFLGNYGTKYGTTTGVTNPGNTGTFVGSDSEFEAATASATGINNNYGAQDAFDNTCGLIFQREAAGIVEAIGPQVQVTSGDVSVVYQGDVILGRLAMGADFLNPAACVELFVGGSSAPSTFGNVYPSNVTTS